ncbi:hypothetical protein Glove_41g75 [Diversispora epigaea]|uniref:Uncharacterized protein n=1 Tax=Diversispora epigaea TaxID=1348612 RepID=A0A397JG28_9GLOM|nr:hypothetical protein Glove_41g75 [Diversispora epigaea]
MGSRIDMLYNKAPLSLLTLHLALVSHCTNAIYSQKNRVNMFHLMKMMNLGSKENNDYKRNKHDQIKSNLKILSIFN